jgi:hypothetical protein
MRTPDFISLLRDLEHRVSGKLRVFLSFKMGRLAERTPSPPRRQVLPDHRPARVKRPRFFRAANATNPRRRIGAVVASRYPVTFGFVLLRVRVSRLRTKPALGHPNQDVMLSVLNASESVCDDSGTCVDAAFVAVHEQLSFLPQLGLRRRRSELLGSMMGLTAEQWLTQQKGSP